MIGTSLQYDNLITDWTQYLSRGTKGRSTSTRGCLVGLMDQLGTGLRKVFVNDSRVIHSPCRDGNLCVLVHPRSGTRVPRLPDFLSLFTFHNHFTRAHCYFYEPNHLAFLPHWERTPHPHRSVPLQDGPGLTVYDHPKSWLSFSHPESSTRL